MLFHFDILFQKRMKHLPFLSASNPIRPLLNCEIFLALVIGKPIPSKGRRRHESTPQGHMKSLLLCKDTVMGKRASYGRLKHR